MDFELSDEQSLLRDTVRDFARQEVAPVAAELDREKRFPYELVAKLGELGLMGIPLPQEYGGGGADTLSYAMAIEELGRVDSSVAITVAAHTSLGTCRSTSGEPTSRSRNGCRSSAAGESWRRSGSPSRRPAPTPATPALPRGWWMASS